MKIALVVEPQDESYLGFFKPLLVGHQVRVIPRKIELIKELTSTYDAIITSRSDLVQRLKFLDRPPSIEDYAGSLFTREGKDFLVINPLRDLVASPPGIFLTTRYITKITQPEKWFLQSEFSWELADEVSISKLYDLLSTADFIATDIETTRGGPCVIRCVGYCGVWLNSDGTFRTHSIVLPYTSLFWVQWVRKINALNNPKIFQNGLFDNLYFFRFGSPVNNWLLDTLEFFHSWYSELPKSLDYITLFLLRNVDYWKKEAESGDLKDLYRYNAKDAWATANSMLALLSQAPAHAFENYKIKFPLVFPCIAASFEGLRYQKEKVNPKDPESIFSQQMRIVEENRKKLEKSIGHSFNPGSWQQVRALIHALTGSYPSESDEKFRAKVAKKHPLNAFFMEKIDKYKEAQKLVGTYLGADLLGEDRLLYNLRPSGTDTGRLSSTKSSFDCGAQIQNFPEYAKQVVIADEGFYLAEADNEKSEAVCLGYISGDQALIESTTSSRDFHSINIERFFGKPYDEVWDSEKGKTKDKPLRDLSKRVNHGTAYVMGAAVLLETMGLENVVKAQIMLGLPKNWTPIKVCEYLLERYHIAYPGVKRDYYEWVKSHVKLHGRLVSSMGWTRICFGQPWNNSRHFKALVAHVPQNLSVTVINKGLLRVFREIQLKNWKYFRIKAQIHDSILFQYRIGALELALEARKLLQQTIPVTDVKGVTRNMTIPVALKAEHKVWSELKKIDI